MLTKEEYQKTLVRMWDSVRTEYKGDDDCDGVECSKCPVEPVCGCTFKSAYDAIDFVEKWGKEHPIKTNGSIYLKAFPNANVCGYEDNGKILHIRLDNSKPSNADDNMIKIPAEWWNKEIE